MRGVAPPTVAVQLSTGTPGLSTPESHEVRVEGWSGALEVWGLDRGGLKDEERGVPLATRALGAAPSGR